MAFEYSSYAGDEIYSKPCKGDAVVGDEVRFQKAVFTGSFKNARFSHFEMVTAKIIKDSYGKDKQQHTFTLKMEDGSNKLIKGRVLYREGLYRKTWADESQRRAVAEEKHERGDAARAVRTLRKESLSL